VAQSQYEKDRPHIMALLQALVPGAVDPRTMEALMPHFEALHADTPSAHRTLYGLILNDNREDLGTVGAGVRKACEEAPALVGEHLLACAVALGDWDTEPAAEEEHPVQTSAQDPDTDATGTFPPAPDGAPAPNVVPGQEPHEG
jgi:hypothetical protein